MSVQPPKLVAVGFQKNTASALLQQFEELYIYGVLSQLSRFTELQYKDVATISDKTVLDAKLTYDAGLSRLQQVCQSSRTNYAFTGVLSHSSGNGPTLGEVKITFRLYEARGNRYIVDEVATLRTDAEGDPQSLYLHAPELNRLINVTTNHFIQAVFGEDPENQMGMAPFSTSIKAMQLVLKAHQSNLSAEKIRLYEAAIQEDPQLETAFYHLARIYKSESQYEKAVIHYRDTLKISHGAVRHKAIYATDAGIICALMGRHDYALQWWLRAIEYDPAYINPYFNIANIYEDQDNYEASEQYFVKAQQLAPDDFRTFFNLARLYSKMGRWENALTQYHLQLRTEDGDPWCHSDVATCYLNLGDMHNAKQHLEKTVALDPEGEAGQYAQLILSGLA